MSKLRIRIAGAAIWPGCRKKSGRKCKLLRTELVTYNPIRTIFGILATRGVYNWVIYKCANN